MYNPSLQGKWYCVSNFTDIVYSFYEDDTFNLEIGEILTFTGTYSIEKNKDRIIFYLNGERISFSFLLFENDLFLVSFKGDGYQIDEILHFKKNVESSHCVVLERNSINSFVMTESNFMDNYVVFNSNSTKDLNGINTINISKSGFTRVEWKEDPYGYILGRLEFLVKDNSGKKKIVPFFRFNQYVNRLDELLAQGYNMDSVYVCLYDFNQISREEINSMFGERVDGNVLCFRRDTLKNLLDNPFLNCSLIRKDN